MLFKTFTILVEYLVSRTKTEETKKYEELFFFPLKKTLILKLLKNKTNMVF